MTRVLRKDWPKDWVIYNLQQVCDIQIGKTPRRDEARYWGGSHTWISISDMTSRVLLESKEQITDAAISEKQANLVKKGSLLMSFKLTIGKLAFAGRDLYTNEAIAALSIKPDFVKILLPEFLYWCLQVIPLENEVDLAAKGKTLNKDKIKRIEIPVPSPNVQRAIIARVEALLSELRDINDLHATIDRDVGEVMESVLDDTFPDVDIPMSSAWRKVAIGSLGTIKGGGTPSKAIPTYWNGAIPWISPKDMKSHYIHQSIDSITSEALKKSSQVSLIPENSVLMVFRSGILAHSFPSAINSVPVTINQDLKAIIPRNEFLPEYIVFALQARKNIILQRHVKKGATVHSINGDNFWNDFIAVPSNGSRKQHQIIAYLNSVREEMIEMQRVQADNRALLEQVEQSILAQAFRGEL